MLKGKNSKVGACTRDVAEVSIVVLTVMHFKWTNCVCLSMDMLISLIMDVVIILAKLVCHLCFVCKLNYLFGAHMCYGGV